MFKRLLFSSAALFVTGGVVMSSVAHARETELVGTLTKVEAQTIEITTNSHETIPVTINANTRYLRWIVAKPWQQDIRANVGSLRVGQRLHVDLADRNPNTAETVWIVTGQVGTID